MKLKRKNLIFYISIALICIFVFKSVLISRFYFDSKVNLNITNLDITHFESEAIVEQVLKETKPIENKIYLQNINVKFNSYGKITDFYAELFSKKEILNETRSISSRINMVNGHLFLISSIISKNTDFYYNSLVTIDLKDGLSGLNKIPWNEFFIKYTADKPNYYSIDFVNYADTSEVASDVKIQRYLVSSDGTKAFTEPQIRGLYSVKYLIIPMYAYGKQFKNAKQYEGRNLTHWYIDYELLK
jgi:hypothetical protein